MTESRRYVACHFQEEIMSLMTAPNPVLFFRDELESAMAKMQVSAQPLTRYYMAMLLADFLHLDSQPLNRALGPELIRALDHRGSIRTIRLREVGDTSLFVSGFFTDSLQRSLINVGYYVRLGKYAYRNIHAPSDDTLAPVFQELESKFVEFVDVLNEVSAQFALHGDSNLLKLYEQWLKTGSKRSQRLLQEQGITPNPAIRAVRVQ
jgi:hypothetical protein